MKRHLMKRHLHSLPGVVAVGAGLALALGAGPVPAKAVRALPTNLSGDYNIVSSSNQ